MRFFQYCIIILILISSTIYARHSIQPFAEEKDFYNNGTVGSPSIQMYSNTVITVYTVKETNGYSVFLSYYTPGHRWSKPIRIKKTHAYMPFPISTAVAQNGKLFLAYENISNTITLLQTAGDYYHWIESVIIPHDTISLIPKIVIHANNAVSLYYHSIKNNGSAYLKVITSDDEGKNWSLPKTLFSRNMYASNAHVLFPEIVSIENTIIAAYQMRSEGHDSIYYTFSDDNGEHWEEPQRIFTDTANYRRPRLLFNPNNRELYLFLESDRQNDWDIYYSKIDFAAHRRPQWLPPHIISDTPSDSFNPMPVRYNDSIIVAWYDYRNIQPGIFLRVLQSTQEEDILGSEIYITKDISNACRNVQSVVGNNTLYLVYQIEAYGTFGIRGVTMPLFIAHPEIRMPQYQQAYKNDAAPVECLIIATNTALFNYSLAFEMTTNKSSESFIRIPNRGFNYIMVSNFCEGTNYIQARIESDSGIFSKTVCTQIVVDARPPSGLHIQSPTHPSLIPVSNNAPVFNYTCTCRDVQGWSYSFSTNEYIEPDYAIQTEDTIVRFSNCAGGLYYFKIRAVDAAGNWSEVATKVIQISDYAEMTN